MLIPQIVKAIGGELSVLDSRLNVLVSQVVLDQSCVMLMEDRFLVTQRSDHTQFVSLGSINHNYTKNV